MKTKFLFIPICLLLLLIQLSCNDLSDPKPNASDPKSPSDDNNATSADKKNQNWVILRKVPAKDDEIASSLFTTDGYWTPSTEDIQIIEGKIVDFLRQNATEFHWQPPVWERLDGYNRQYIGLEHEGKKVIFGNYFCESGKQDWKRRLIFAIDGGECYFQVEYDLETGLFSKLYVNGES